MAVEFLSDDFPEKATWRCCVCVCACVGLFIFVWVEIPGPEVVVHMNLAQL